MSVLNVAFYGSDEMASNIAKKGDSRDVVSYVFKEIKDDKVRILSLLRPLKHPESIRPLPVSYSHLTLPTICSV